MARCKWCHKLDNRVKSDNWFCSDKCFLLYETGDEFGREIYNR